jgi:hypothetical protein
VCGRTSSRLSSCLMRACCAARSLRSVSMVLTISARSTTESSMCTTASMRPPFVVIAMSPSAQRGASASTRTMRVVSHGAPSLAREGRWMWGASGAGVAVCARARARTANSGGGDKAMVCGDWEGPTLDGTEEGGEEDLRRASAQSNARSIDGSARVSQRRAAESCIRCECASVRGRG